MVARHVVQEVWAKHGSPAEQEVRTEEAAGQVALERTHALVVAPSHHWHPAALAWQPVQVLSEAQGLALAQFVIEVLPAPRQTAVHDSTLLVLHHAHLLALVVV